jgi:hypothetical protein
MNIWGTTGHSGLKEASSVMIVALRRAVCLVLMVGGLSVGCGGDSDPEGQPAPGDGSSSVTGARTFYGDAAPIFAAKCVGCHQTDGIAPFALDDYSAARQRASQIADYTEQRIMPPYLMETGGACGSFDESVALTEGEIATIGAWAEGGALEGTPTELRRVPPPELEGGSEFNTPEFTPIIVGGDLARFDEYRCFELDGPTDADGFITGYDVVPGTPELVHHVAAFVVDPEHMADGVQTNRQVMDALHAADPNPSRDGWSCFGMAGEGLDVESMPVIWAPGQGVVEYPDGLGVPLPRGRKLVVQVHYNMASAAPAPDQTKIRLRLVPDVARQAVFLTGDALLDTLFGPEPAKLEAGQASIKYTWEMAAREQGIPDQFRADLVSLFPHMHERGHKYTFEIAQGAGDYECQGRINSWDFNWQRIYDYTQPIPFDADTKIRVTCDYDTSRDTEDVLPGWGTRNEMCFVMMLLALPADG